MKILVAYSSKTGTTEKAAQTLSDALLARDADVELCDLAHNTPALCEYDAAAIGGSIRMNTLHKAAANYLKANAAALEKLPFGVFCCRCGKDDTKALLEKQLPAALLSSAVSVASFGGELDLAKQKGFDRFVVTMVSKSDKSGDMKPEGILSDRIKAFADALLKAAGRNA